MKAEFLDVDPTYFSEVVFSDHLGDTTQDLAKADGENLLGLRINEGGFMGWHTFGGTYWVDNSLHGTKSLGRYMTGGSPHNHGTVGGASVENDYATALAHPDRISKKDEWTIGSGTRLWIGAGAPAGIDASKKGVLSLTCLGANDTDIIAVYSAENP